MYLIRLRCLIREKYTSALIWLLFECYFSFTRIIRRNLYVTHKFDFRKLKKPFYPAPCRFIAVYNRLRNNRTWKSFCESLCSTTNWLKSFVNSEKSTSNRENLWRIICPMHVHATKPDRQITIAFDRFHVYFMWLIIQ